VEVEIPAILTREQQAKAKRYILKNHIYKIMAYVFIFIGLFLFIVFYTQFIKGDVFNFIRNPLTIFIVLSPFIPSLVMLLLSKSSSNKANQVIQQARMNS
jgi:hypothetical protein